MLASEIKIIEKELDIKLPDFYIQTMLNYPYPDDSFAAELTLCNNVEGIISNNSIFEKKQNCFAVGSDGGEFIYFIRINEGEKVYIYDFEQSDKSLSIEAESWYEYLRNLEEIDKRILEDELKMAAKKRNKKWWQFWIEK